MYFVNKFDLKRPKVKATIGDFKKIILDLFKILTMVSLGSSQMRKKKKSLNIQ